MIRPRRFQVYGLGCESPETEASGYLSLSTSSYFVPLGRDTVSGFGLVTSVEYSRFLRSRYLAFRDRATQVAVNGHLLYCQMPRSALPSAVSQTCKMSEYDRVETSDPWSGKYVQHSRRIQQHFAYSTKRPPPMFLSSGYLRCQARARTRPAIQERSFAESFQSGDKKREHRCAATIDSPINATASYLQNWSTGKQTSPSATDGNNPR